MPKVVPILLPTSQVAARLGLHVRSVHRMVERGEIAPATKVPGLRGPLLFTEDEVARVERRRTEAAS